LVTTTPATDYMEQLVQYMQHARTLDLPPEVARKGKHHILDTIAAMVSGSELEPGKLAIGYIRGAGGPPEATVVGSNIRTSVVNAALANGMLAHADETDDSNPAGLHPGCAILPAALALAEQQGARGKALLNGVVLGYDVGCRSMHALGREPGGELRRFSEKGVGGVMGAAAAASVFLHLTSVQLRHMFGYAAQQASGIRSYMTDQSHVEKAFAFGGMPARNGVAAATMVDAGLTGEWDVFRGPYHNFLDSYSDHPVPEELTKELGERFEVMLTRIKKDCVGSPIQAPAEALRNIINEHGIKASDVVRVDVKTSPSSIATVDDRAMPDVNMQYILSVLLLDGVLTFKAAHDYERMKDAVVLQVKQKINLHKDPAIGRGGVQASVDVTTADGRVLSHQPKAIKGTVDNPMTDEEVTWKAQDLMAPVLGEDEAQEVIRTIMGLEGLNDVRDLTALLRKETGI
jgi:2-methylcitrate dehydratase PrpD